MTVSRGENSREKDSRI